MPNTRICSHCGKPMRAGYCIEGGSEYYCSDECLHEHYTEEEYLEMYDGGEGDSYWTEWEEDEDDPDDLAPTNSDVFPPQQP